mmetsp:Transcript_11533/g.46673  ORF Transcript_11533/g.46673 Transcript_11533/m.46673 type:complete len:238 (-) Transcript_11533:61-774(-)
MPVHRRRPLRGSRGADEAAAARAPRAEQGRPARAARRARRDRRLGRIRRRRTPHGARRRGRRPRERRCALGRGGGSRSAAQTTRPRGAPRPRRARDADAEAQGPRGHAAREPRRGAERRRRAPGARQARGQVEPRPLRHDRRLHRHLLLLQRLGLSGLTFSGAVQTRFSSRWGRAACVSASTKTGSVASDVCQSSRGAPLSHKHPSALYSPGCCACVSKIMPLMLVVVRWWKTHNTF